MNDICKCVCEDQLKNVIWTNKLKVVSVPDAHAKTLKGVWANAVEFLTT